MSIIVRVENESKLIVQVEVRFVLTCLFVNYLFFIILNVDKEQYIRCSRKYYNDGVFSLQGAWGMFLNCKILTRT